VSADVEIDGWLAELGFGLEASRRAARQSLEAAGITRAGKQRLSVEKLDRAEEMLRSLFFLHCASSECVSYATASGKTMLACEPRSTCMRCGGSSNQRAVTELLELLRAEQKGRVVIVGGSPPTRQELERLVGDSIELRLIDGTKGRPAELAKVDLLWADVVVLWGATELHHKVSNQYQDGAAAVPAWKRKLVHVPKRGIAQLLAGAIDHLRR
jgi:hypothetical protein